MNPTLPNEDTSTPVSASPRLPVSVSLPPGPALRPGYQTTEFWLHAILVLGSLVISSGLVQHDSPVAAAVTAVLGLLSTGQYSAGRNALKKTLPLIVPCLLASLSSVALRVGGCMLLALPLLTGCTTVPTNQITLPGGYSVAAPKNVDIRDFKATLPDGTKVEFSRWSSTNDARVVSAAAAGNALQIESALKGAVNLLEAYKGMQPTSGTSDAAAKTAVP